MAIRSAEAELEAGNNGAAAKPKEDPKAEVGCSLAVRFSQTLMAFV